jgi:2-amino-4-hydroxy-6-hydroxymethyldihydropteridine diphosphokinase
MHEVIISIGSNIDPEENLKKSLLLLARKLTILDYSHIWKSKSFGSSGPDFLNMAVKVKTKLDRKSIKEKILRKIEIDLGRKKLPDKNAPRTIDLDIVVFNGKVIDDDVWSKVFVTIPVSEIEPTLQNPFSAKDIRLIAQEMKNLDQAELYSVSEDFFSF